MTKFAPSFVLVAVLAASCTGDDVNVSQGRLQRIVLDRPERGESTVQYLLTSDDGEEIELALEGSRDEARWRALPSGARLRVAGPFAATPAGERRRLLAEHIETDAEADDYDELASALIVDPANPPAPRKLAVVLFNFQNDDRQPLSVEDARQKIFTDPNSTRAFHKEQSYGFIDLGGKLDRQNGDVFGWYTLPANNRPCLESKWDDMALAAANAKGIDTTGYDHYVFIFPYTDACVYGGRGEQPGKNTWINGGSIRTMNHELGHNFGTPHASTWTCTNAAGERVSISGSCRVTEYGNPFDVMGHGYRHTNAFNKARARWLGSKNIVDVGKAGVYTLLPQERPSDGVQLLSVVATETSSYYVEYRQPFGYDDFAPDSAAASGIIILYGGGLRTLTNSYLLDMNPATTTFADAPLAVGKTFVASDVKITLVERTAQAAQVRFDFADGGPPVFDRDAGRDGARDAGAADLAAETAGGNGGNGGNGETTGSGGTGGAARGGGSGSGGRPGSGTGGSAVTRPADIGETPRETGCSCDVGGATRTPASAPVVVFLVLGAVLLRLRRRCPPLLLLGLLAFSLVGAACQDEARGLPTNLDPARGTGGTGGRGGQPGQGGSAGAGPGSGGRETGGQSGGGGQDSGGQGGAPVTEQLDAPATISRDAGISDAPRADAGDGGVTSTFTLNAAPPDVAAACAAYAETYCQRLAECVTDGVVRNYGDVTFCKVRREQTCRLDLLTPGRTESTARRQSCTDALARQSCRDYYWGRPLPACDYPAGTIKQGEACHRASQCAAGLACEIEIDETCGTCQPVLPLGGDCSFWTGGCPQGAACYADQCLMPIAKGAACKRTAASCLGGMTCTDTGCAEKLGAAGADCARNDVCDPLQSLFCDLTVGKCAPLPAPVEIGKPCGVVDASGAASRCGEGAVCFAPPASPTRRICVARLPAGSKCDTATGPLCAPPAECTRGVCVVPRIVMGAAPTYRQCP